MPFSRTKFRGSQLGKLVRWTAYGVGLVLVFFNIGNIFVFNQLEPLVSKRMGENQVLTTVAISEALRPSRIRSFNVKPDGITGRLLTNTLDEFLESGQFVSVTLLDTTGVVVYSSGGGYESDEYFNYLAIDKGAFNSALSAIPAYTELYESGGSYLRGAYAPVVDELGEVGWILGTEAGAEYYAILDALKRNLLLFIFLSVVVAIVAGAILLSAAVELNRMEHRLIQASTLSSIGEVAAGMAHEVRNPLAIISGSAERMLKCETLGEREQLGTYIVEEVARIDDILTGYLSFARPAVEDTAPTLLGEVAKDVAERVRERAQKSDIEVVVDIKEDDIVLISDSAFRRAILNIYLNAIDAMESGGTLNIRCRKSGADLLLTIEDTGEGMHRNTIDRIFEPFVTSKSNGTGLGLSLARNIIENADGKIYVKSELGVGTAFSIKLPISA